MGALVSQHPRYHGVVNKKKILISLILHKNMHLIVLCGNAVITNEAGYFSQFIGHLYFPSFVNYQFMAHTHFSISLFVFS